LVRVRFSVIFLSRKANAMVFVINSEHCVNATADVVASRRWLTKFAHFHVAIEPVWASKTVNKIIIIPIT
jgi:hypothetical protein